MNAPHTPLLPHQTGRLNKRRKRRGTRKFKNWSFRAMARHFTETLNLSDMYTTWFLRCDGKVREIKLK